MRLDLPLGIFDMDTLKIIPHYNKTVFARNKIYEADRVDGIVPYFNITGLKLYHQDTLWIDAKKATTQAFLKIYRDKRLPMKAVRKPLPTEMIRTLNFGLSIENLILNKSYVEYEEFLEDADSSGFVFFDDLYASIRGIDNTAHANDGSILLNAEGALMGQGKVKIKASFPMDVKKKNSMKGTVTNFKIPTINTILEPAAQIKAESGYLHSLAFQFNYDDQHAQGEIELNYNDLKLSTFKVVEAKHSGSGKKKAASDSNEEVKKDGLKSFILNAFIIRKNMDEKLPEDKRTGTISFDRDQRKSVFNYWWKSVFSGVKSAYNIDKLEEKKAKKLARKNKDK
jgi:hypothetical protein